METEELYDNELIDEIADEVLLALEEERPDETYDGEVDKWAEACQAEFAQLLDGAIGAAPPPAILTEPALPPNWDEVRDLLNEFFRKRVYDKTQTMNWPINGNLPRKGKDTEFDKLLQDQGIISNRRYQSQCWLKFRKANGLVPAPTYKWEDSDQLRGQLQSPYIRPDSILTSAIESTKTILYSLMRAYYLLILPCYGKMKSSDILRLERESGPVATSSDTLPTRLKVLIAHENAKGK
jgi:hypothetical protein